MVRGVTFKPHFQPLSLKFAILISEFQYRAIRYQEQICFRKTQDSLCAAQCGNIGVVKEGVPGRRRRRLRFKNANFGRRRRPRAVSKDAEGAQGSYKGRRRRPGRRPNEIQRAPKASRKVPKAPRDATERSIAMFELTSMGRSGRRASPETRKN